MSRRDEVLDVALSLFAEQGYAATSVAQIEAALGIRPGSGGLYRHVTSKQQLLQDAVDRALQSQKHPPSGPFRSLGHALVCSVLQVVDADLDLWKLLVREPRLPIDLDDVYARVVQPAFDQSAGWMAGGATPSPALRAKVTVALSALLYLRISQFTYHRVPAGLSEDDFVATVEQLLTEAAA